MIRIRPYKASDASTILSWCSDEKSFYQWTAGILGDFPITEKDFMFVESLMPFTAFDKTGIIGLYETGTEIFCDFKYGIQCSCVRSI